jgi:beta-lactam-binding protein with PASTA domain
VFKFITHRPLWVNILTGIALAGIIFFIFLFSLNWCTNHNQSKTVPAVLGKSFEEAVDILERAGFEAEIQDSIYTDTSKALTVLKQVPEADEMVKVNRTVYLTINRAVPPIVEVPNLKSFSYRSAEMALKNAHLQVGEISYKPDFAKDAVLEMLYQGKPIAAFTKIQMGSKISLVLGDGLGDKQFPVPSLVGKTYCEAKSILQDLGVAFGVTLAPGITDTCNAFIYWQSPERYDDERKFRMIRPGQLIDVKLQEERPVTDSIGVSANPGLPE